MGLFNFIYKLTNILSNKRKIKVFVIIAIIILILFCWSRGAFAVEPTPEENNALMNYQLQMQNAALSYLEFLKNGNRLDNATFNQFLRYLPEYNIYISTSQSDNAQFLIYLYLTNVDGGRHYNDIASFTIDGTWSVGYDLQTGVYSGIQYPCKFAQFEGWCYRINRNGVSGLQTMEAPVWTNDFYLPDACFMVRSTKVQEFLEEYNAFNQLPTTYQTHDAETEAAISSGLTNTVNAVNNMNSTLQDVNSSVEDVNESVQDVNTSVMQAIEEITDPYVNVTQQQLPSQEVTDGTAEPLNTLFDYIKNAFTGEPTGFSLPLPFVRW